MDNKYVLTSAPGSRMSGTNTALMDSAAALWDKFTTWEVPVHSLLVSGKKELLWESYGQPYGPQTLHRMFSITKSYTSLAVGCLYAEGTLSLDDPIIRYFPEYLPQNGRVHPYLSSMTIRHMLAMQTCHSSTTYKLHPNRNWVESFFITPPSHRSGQIFFYDTSSSHTLAALVKKLTGLGVLDYLRTRFLNRIGFSEKAYIIRDPFGSELGGSGLMARPMDLLLTARCLMERLEHGEGAFPDYLREAVSFQTPTLHIGQTLDEQQGYGYQFWRIRNGFAMYGMGGQYVLFYPQPELIFVITADSQNIKGGNQRILDSVHEMFSPCLGQPAPSEKRGTCSLYAPLGNSNACITTTAETSYRLLPCPGGFTGLSVSLDPEGGCITLVRPETAYQIPFGYHSLRTAVLARYNQPIASSGWKLDGQSLFIRTQLVGERIGSLSFMLRFRPDGLTLWMKKIEETCFQEFDGFVEGIPDTLPYREAQIQEESIEDETEYRNEMS